MAAAHVPAPAPQLFTRVSAACDASLLGQPELLIAVQDFLLPLVEIGPAVALRVGGMKLLTLWLDVAAFQGVGMDEYSGAAMFTAIQQSGEVFLDRALSANVRGSVWTSVANFAVRHNDLALLQTLHDRLPLLNAPHALEIAADMGDASLVSWIHKSGFGNSVVTEQTLARAASKAHLHIIHWFVTTQEPYNKDDMVRRAMNRAALYGQSEVLRWLREHSNVWWSPHAIGAALLNGHYALADWMHERNLTRLETYVYQNDDPSPPHLDVNLVMREAFTKGDVRVLDWLRTREGLQLPLISNKYTERAKKAGHVHMLDYVAKHFPGSTSALYFSPVCASGGSIPVAQWALERQMLSNAARVVTTAARHGHIDFMRWYTNAMQGQIVPEQDPLALEMTAGKGHFECVRFLIENNFSVVTSSAVAHAASNGHLEIAQWLLALLPEVTLVDTDATEEVAGDDNARDHPADRTRRRWLRYAVHQAAANGHLDVVKWIFGMQKIQITVEPDVTRDAAGNGHLSVVQFLVKHAPECGILNAASSAALRGQLRIVKYLLSHTPQSRQVCELLVKKAMDGYHTHVAKWIERYGSKALP